MAIARRWVGASLAVIGAHLGSRVSKSFALLFAIAFCIPLATSHAQFGDRGVSGLERADSPRVLPADDAFPLSVGARDDDTLTFTWTPAPEHYLYRHRFSFELKGTPTEESATPLPFELEAGVKMHDEFFGEIEAYFDRVSVRLSVDQQDVLPSAVLVVRYQGCAAWGFCYPPQNKEWSLVELGW